MLPVFIFIQYLFYCADSDTYIRYNVTAELEYTYICCFDWEKFVAVFYFIYIIVIIMFFFLYFLCAAGILFMFSIVFCIVRQSQNEVNCQNNKATSDKFTHTWLELNNNERTRRWLKQIETFSVYQNQNVCMKTELCFLTNIHKLTKPCTTQPFDCLFLVFACFT